MTTDYSKISTKKKVTKTNTVENTDVSEKKEDTEDTVLEEKTKMLIGIVDNCSLLNVREKPSTESKVMCVIKAGEDVTIFNEMSNSEWYYVKAGDVNGYCLKKYINIA